MFKGLLLAKEGEAFTARLADLDDAQLPEATSSASRILDHQLQGRARAHQQLAHRAQVADGRGIDAAGVVDASGIRAGSRATA
jgi:hypothetical protein